MNAAVSLRQSRRAVGLHVEETSSTLNHLSLYALNLTKLPCTQVIVFAAN